MVGGWVEREHHANHGSGFRLGLDRVLARDPLDDLQAEASRFPASTRGPQPHPIITDHDGELGVLALDADVDGAPPRPIRVAHDIRHGFADTEPHVVDESFVSYEPGDDLAHGSTGFSNTRRGRLEGEVETGREGSHLG